MSILWMIVGIVVGFAAGFVLAFLIQKSKQALLAAQMASAQTEKDNAATELEKMRADLATKMVEQATTVTKMEGLKEQLAEQKQAMADLQKRLTTEFENMANRILKERAAELSETSKKDLSAILNPLKDNIAEFKQQVHEAYSLEMRDKAGLREQLKLLTEQNARISDEANNLTKALKGDVKQQGNWGEIVLERVLEMSGLHIGREFEREAVSKDDNDANKRPDVIVHLPDNKHVVIDSKVSLVAYDRLVNAPDNAAYETALKDQVSSLKKHVNELAAKNYPNLPGLNAPDFVLMFVPIEAMFSVAVDADKNLFAYAWEKKIVIVSPTTLLATLRTIASIWQQENQTKNAFEIARLGGVLYDKMVGFIDDFQKIKRSLDAADKAYNDALGKMSTGKGNMLNTATRIKELGAKAGKTIPQNLLQDAEE
ncbi:MAG: DNA recombination protein RmuC [Paludibacteraceae bacterium]|nr:DNA recombination protein RmuC [Paludibacteraceae bacterium]